MNGVSRMLTSQTPGVKAGAPEPTKVLEIISGCNWESHRSLVLKELFRSIHSDRLSALHSIDVYRVELLSENLKADATGSTLTYKVCVSLPEKTLETPEPRQEGKTRAECVRNSSQRANRPNKRADVSVDAGETRAKRFPLLSRVVPAGHLTAERKTAVCSGCIKVNGKAYAQAKLCLGRMGALHPANRLAAYLTGRIQPAPLNTRSQSKPAPLNTRSQSKPVQLLETRDSCPHTADQSKGAFRAPATQTLAIYQAPDGIKRTPTLYIFSHVHNPAAPPSTSNHVTSSQPGLILTAVAPPLSCVATVAPPLLDTPAVVPPLSDPTAVAPPLSDPTNVAPPLSDPTAVAPPLSGATAVAPPLPDPTAVAPPLSGATSVAPPLPSLTAVAPPLSDQNAVAPPLSDPTAVAQPLAGPPTVAPPLSLAPPLPQTEAVLLASALAPPPAVAPPLSQTETVLPASALAPGQQVVLQPVAGMMGVNMCQFNGQTIQLVPVPSASPVPSAGSAQQEVQTSTQRPRSTKSVLNPAPSPKHVPFIAPRIHSAPGNTSFTFGSAAHNGFPAKNNMFSFRIFPPASSGLQHTEPGGAGSSVLLPGGYRLIKLPTAAQPGVNPERGPSGSTESPREDTHQSSVPIEAEPSETPLAIKVEPCSESLRTGQHQDIGGAERGAVRIKIEPYEEIHQNRDPNEVSSLKAEEPDPETNIRPSESGGPVPAESRPHPKTNISGDFSCSLFASPISAFSKRTFAVPQTQTHTPEAPHAHTHTAPVDGDRRREEGQNRIQWLWKRSAPARVSEGSGSGLAADGSSAALLYSSDGWTTEDSNEKSSEDEVDIEAFGEDDERIIGRLRAKARRTTPRAAPHQWLLKAKLVGKASHHAVRMMSDLPVYKRSFRLNQALRERKRQVQLHQSLDSLRRTLCVEDDSMSTEDLLRQARRVVGALEDHGRSLLAQKRALIQQHSHYQTLISQRSVAGTELHVEQKSAAPSSETPQSVVKRHSRLPNIVLQSFTSPKPVLHQS